MRVNALKCIKTHCLRFDSLLKKVIKYTLDLLNDMKKDVQIYAMSFLLKVLKEYKYINKNSEYIIEI